MKGKWFFPALAAVLFVGGGYALVSNDQRSDQVPAGQRTTARSTAVQPSPSQEPAQTIQPCAYEGAPRKIQNEIVCLDEEFRRNYERAQPSPEILHGSPTDGHDETVMLTQVRGRLICTGVLIGQRLVVTARHCVRDDHVGVKGSKVYFGTDPYSSSSRSILVSDAKFYCDGDLDPNTNPNRCDDNDKGNDLDLALVHLEAQAKTIGTIKPALFAEPKDMDMEKNFFVRIVGFGEDQYGHTERKLYAKAPIASKTCGRQLSLKPSNVRVEDARLYGCRKGAELVAGYYARDFNERRGLDADTCRGDSGGPAFVVAASDAVSDDSIAVAYEAKRYRLAAITSRGIQVDKRVRVSTPRCGYGGIYVLVLTSGRAHEWIEKTAKLWNEKIEGE